MIRRSKVGAGTATDVVQILNVLRHFPWLMMRDITAIRVLSLNAVASSLVNLRPAHHVEVRR